MKKSLKTKLKNNELAVGGWIMIGHPAVAEIMGRSGLDWVAIDMEHSAITTQQAEDLIRAVGYDSGTPALVRLTNNDPNLIKRVMDSGASGIIVPLIMSADEAAAAVQALYYPPRGTRGVGLARAQGYGASFQDYRAWLEAEAVCITQIEHIEAVKRIDSILAVPGVDGYMIGPYDLSASMGLAGQLDHPDVLVAVETVRKAGVAAGKPGGIHIVEPDTARLKDAVGKGFTFIAYGIDTRMIDTACRAGVSAVR